MILADTKRVSERGIETNQRGGRDVAIQDTKRTDHRYTKPTGGETQIDRQLDRQAGRQRQTDRQAEIGHTGKKTDS